jgi:hypothetical protein
VTDKLRARNGLQSRAVPARGGSSLLGDTNSECNPRKRLLHV